MTTIYIDNQPYQVKQEGTNLLAACLSLGFNLPYFCWHPVMHSVGACRQCAVKLFRGPQDTAGRIVMSCMTPVTDGMRISIDDPEAAAFRAKVIEWLMLNHPHDCPVCDEGGECHLQDMTIMTGHTYRRTRFPKRTFRNQDLGPFVTHEMNRCIQCYRCVRFYRDYAGGRDFGVFGWHDGVYFGRSRDGALESEFSGNLVEICPTGVFTDKTLAKHYTRKWDLQTAPSICVHCGLGCNTTPGERYGTLRRIRARFNSEVNGYFLCDRGRYGYEFVNSDRRIRQPMLRGSSGRLEPASEQEALTRAGELVRTGKVIGIGSARATVESNFALRSLVGANQFHIGMSRSAMAAPRAVVSCLSDGLAPAASLREAGEADAVAVFGEDVLNVAPMLGLALRQAALRKPMEEAAAANIQRWQDASIREAIQDRRGPFFVAASGATKLDELATAVSSAAPDDLVRLAQAVAHRIDSSCPGPGDLPGDHAALADRIASALMRAKRPLVVSGCSCGEAMVRAAANVAWALCAKGKDVRICFTVPDCNSIGAAIMTANDADGALEALRCGQADTVILMENDLSGAGPAGEQILMLARQVIVIDCLPSLACDRADCVLPAATFADGSGTLVNNEGRAQRFYRVMPPQPPIQESWRWIGQLLVAAGWRAGQPWPNLDAVVAELASTLPAFAKVTDIAPPADYRQLGQKIPRQPIRYSGRTAINANVNIHEQAPPGDVDSPLAFTMEGSPAQPPASLVPRYWSPGWNSDQAAIKFQIEAMPAGRQVGGQLHGGDGGVRLISPTLLSLAPSSYHGYVPAGGEGGP